MMFPKYSADKKSASFDFKQAFKTNSIIGIVALILTAYEFIVKVLDDINLYISDVFLNFMNEVPPSALSILGNAEYVQTFREKTHVGAVLTGEYSVYHVVVICAIIGAMFSLCFAYSMKKKNVNFYYSIPVDKATMFKNRVLTAVIWIVIVFAVPIFFDLLINIRFFGNSVYMVKLAISLFAECLVYTLAGFVICTIGIVSCYTIIEGIFFAGTLYTFPTALVFAADFLCNGFLRGYNRATVISTIFSMSSSSAYLQDKSILLKSALFNPVLLGTKLNAQSYRENIISLCNVQGTLGDDGKAIIKYTLPDMNYIAPLIIWAVLIAAGFFLAKYIFTHKKMENSSIHASNRFATGFFALQLSLCVSTVFAMMNIKFVNAKLNLLINFLVILVVLVAVYYITVSICKRKAIHDLKTYVTPLITGGIVGAICLVLGTGLFGFANVPSTDKIEYATISSNGMVDITYGNTNMGNYPFKYYSDESVIGIFSDKGDIDKFVKAAQDVSANGKNMENCDITFAYKLKNGKIIKRRFNTADKDAIYNLLSLTDTKEYKENLNNFVLKDGDTNLKLLKEKAEIFNADTDVFGNSFWSNNSENSALVNYGTVNVFKKGKNLFDIKNSEELRTALAKDFALMTFEQRFKPTEKEICTLTFIRHQAYQDGEVLDGKVLDYEYMEDVSYDNSISYAVYPSMKNTVDFLKTLDDDTTAILFSSEIKLEDRYNKAIVTTPEEYNGEYNFYSRVFAGSDEYYYDYIVDDRLFNTKVEITDKTKMSQLYEIGKEKWYAEEGDLLLLLFSSKKDVNNNSQCVALIIPKDDIPDWLKAQIK